MHVDTTRLYTVLFAFAHSTQRQILCSTNRRAFGEHVVAPDVEKRRAHFLGRHMSGTGSMKPQLPVFVNCFRASCQRVFARLAGPCRSCPARLRLLLLRIHGQPCYACDKGVISPPAHPPLVSLALSPTGRASVVRHRAPVRLLRQLRPRNRGVRRLPKDGSQLRAGPRGKCFLRTFFFARARTCFCSLGWSQLAPIWWRASG